LSDQPPIHFGEFRRNQAGLGKFKFDGAIGQGTEAQGADLPAAADWRGWLRESQRIRDRTNADIGSVAQRKAGASAEETAWCDGDIVFTGDEFHEGRVVNDFKAAAVELVTTIDLNGNGKLLPAGETANSCPLVN